MDSARGARFLVLGCFVGLLVWGCSDSEPSAPDVSVSVVAVPEVEEVPDSVVEVPASVAGGDVSVAEDVVADVSGGDGSLEEDIVVYMNPGFEPRTLDLARNQSVIGSTPLQVVQWLDGPTWIPGAVFGVGRVADGFELVDPWVGDAAVLAIGFEGQPDPVLYLVPLLGDGTMWESFETLADMDWRVENNEFAFDAWSPLFMDTDPEGLELRVYGVNSEGVDVLLAVQPFTAG